MAALYNNLFTILLLSLIFLLSGTSWVNGSSSSTNNELPTKLFVFGDSFVDTGNTPNKSISSWKVPYGITFPGKPSGRFSNGRVWTDYIASFLKINSPFPYKSGNNIANKDQLKNGMDFAYGGPGLFDIDENFPNITTQIDNFNEMIKNKNFTTLDLQSSVVLVSLGINDYLTYFLGNGSTTSQEWKSTIKQVVNQLVMDLSRIQATGVKKILVDGLHPVGCIPYVAAATSYKMCDNTTNGLIQFHNLLLQQSIGRLNSLAKGDVFLYLDLYTAFFNVFKSPGNSPGSLEFQNPLKPCCTGKSSEYNCGDVDAKGSKQYTLCNNPNSSFFWDAFHPTQEAWLKVYMALQSVLQRI